MSMDNQRVPGENQIISGSPNPSPNPTNQSTFLNSHSLRSSSLAIPSGSAFFPSALDSGSVSLENASDLNNNDINTQSLDANHRSSADAAVASVASESSISNPMKPTTGNMNDSDSNVANIASQGDGNISRPIIDDHLDDVVDVAVDVSTVIDDVVNDDEDVDTLAKPLINAIGSLNLDADTKQEPKTHTPPEIVDSSAAIDQMAQPNPLPGQVFHPQFWQPQPFYYSSSLALSVSLTPLNAWSSSPFGPTTGTGNSQTPPQFYDESFKLENDFKSFDLWGIEKQNQGQNQGQGQGHQENPLTSHGMDANGNQGIARNHPPQNLQSMIQLPMYHQYNEMNNGVPLASNLTVNGDAVAGPNRSGVDQYFNRMPMYDSNMNQGVLNNANLMGNHYQHQHQHQHLHRQHQYSHFRGNNNNVSNNNHGHLPNPNSHRKFNPNFNNNGNHHPGNNNNQNHNHNNLNNSRRYDVTNVHRKMNTHRRKGDDAAKYANAKLEDFGGEIYQLCRDQHGCRFLQRQIDQEASTNSTSSSTSTLNAPPSDEPLEEDRNSVVNSSNSKKPTNIASTMIFNEIYLKIVELMVDPFGNYLIQKLFEHVLVDQRVILVKNAAPEFVKIALDPHGTRALQTLIECITIDEEYQLVILLLQPHIVTLSRDLNGNHVVQKCLQKFLPKDNQFIFDIALDHCNDIATHRHGCCVLQRCLDYGDLQQRKQLLQKVAENATNLSLDPFGNYVVQYVLSRGDEELISIILNHIKFNVIQLLLHKFGLNVIEKLLRIPDLSPVLIKVILENKDRFLEMLNDAYGNYVLQTLLEVADRECLNKLLESLQPLLPNIKNTPHGRRITSKIQLI